MHREPQSTDTPRSLAKRFSALRCGGAALVTVVTACSAAPVATTPPARPTSSTAVATTAPPATETPVTGLSLVEEEDFSFTPPPEPIPASALPVFAGRFEPVKLPKKVPAILAVNGTGDRDVWLLPAGGPVMQWDGSRVSERGTPQCYTDTCCGILVDCARNPGRCRKKGECAYGDTTCVQPVTWSFLDVTPAGVAVGASTYTGGMRGSVVFARPRKGGGFTCEQNLDDNAYPGSRGMGDPGHAEEVTLDGVAIRFEGPAVLVNSYGGHHLTVAGRAVPLPPDLQYRSGGFLARSAADLWVWLDDPGQVFRGDGLKWTPVETGLLTVTRVWATGPDLVWALGGEELVVLDMKAGTEKRYSVPGATRVLAGPRELWLLGDEATLGEDGPILDMTEKSFYFWDGQALARAGSPLALGGAWRSPSGDLWVAGADRTAKNPEGVVFRVARTGGKP